MIQASGPVERFQRSYSDVIKKKKENIIIINPKYNKKVRPLKN